MAHSKYANARVVQPHVSQRGWGKVRKTASTPSRDLVAQASEILGQPFDPHKYLLTHSTIVASVDVEPVQGVKLGRVKVGSETINRKFSDYYISPKCSQFVNNNGDAWSRDVLLASYQTFIGGHNFLEHVQIEEQSKGRIIDAVARDIGDSVYIDILVATDRRHAQLVADIESGKMGTLSMGCSVEETICTQCGNVAKDETELCSHIKYNKLNHFHDHRNQRRVVAELCGHTSIEPNAGVTFIEASWVATPAFTGAVLRNILQPGDVSPETIKRAQEVLSSMPAEWTDEQRMFTARKELNPGRIISVPGLAPAKTRVAFGFDDEDGGEGEEAPADDKGPLDETVDEVVQTVTDRAKKRIKDDLRKDDEADNLGPEDSTAWTNDSIVKQAKAESYRNSLAVLSRTASSDVELVDRFASLNAAYGIKVHRDVYRASLKVGSLASYSSMSRFLKACKHSLNRDITPADARIMLRIGKLLSRQGS